MGVTWNVYVGEAVWRFDGLETRRMDCSPAARTVRFIACHQ
mgnify:CR=1 FL=1